MFDKVKDRLVFSDWVLILSIFLTGGFNEYISCVLSCVISVYFIVRLFLNKTLRVQVNVFSIAIVMVGVFYGLTCFWAIDSGMAFIGFLKFLPVVLFMVMLWQEERKTEILQFLPYIATGMVVLSAIGAQISALQAFFSVAGRFAGFFQYPNTFAMFLLVSELLILQKGHLKKFDYLSLCILIGGILYTGSRTVFILFILSNFVMILLVVNKKMRVTMLLVTVVAFAAIVAVMLLFRDNAIINRYLSIGFGASTFIGRILYFLDALPLLIKYPFGMGYLGYYYMQNSIQSGVYNVSYVHNDFLQLFLDIGWIPAILFVAAVIKFFCKKTVPMTQKVIVGALCLHTLFDFNLQFVAMFFLLILLVDVEEGKVRIWKSGTVWKSVFIGVTVLNAYMAFSLILSHYGQNDLANTLYPYNTRNNLQMMEEETDLEYAAKIADRILKQNETYFAPYSIKAKYAYSVGDFVGVIENKNAVFERYPFKYTEYKEYCVMLINGVAVFTRQGDMGSVEVCNQEILSAYYKLQSNKERLSVLGSKISEQPIMDFSENVAQYLEKLLKEAKE